MINSFQISLDGPGNSALQDFLQLRENLVLKFAESSSSALSPSTTVLSHADPKTPRSAKSHSIKPEEILKAEADAILDIAEDELKGGFKKSAARNFHAATVFYRVLGTFKVTFIRYQENTSS